MASFLSFLFAGKAEAPKSEKTKRPLAGDDFNLCNGI